MMNTCEHRPTTIVDHKLREVIHTCAACGHIETSTLHSVATPPKDLWRAVAGDGHVK